MIALFSEVISDSVCHKVRIIQINSDKHNLCCIISIDIHEMINIYYYTIHYCITIDIVNLITIDIVRY